MLRWYASEYLEQKSYPDSEQKYAEMLFEPTGDSDWTRWTNDELRAIDITACLPLSETEYTYIQASRLSNTTEPVLAWNSTSSKLSTVAIRRQLKAVRGESSVEERGLLGLGLHGNTPALPKDSTIETPWYRNWITKNDSSAVSLGSRDAFEWSQLNFLHDIIQDTGRADTLLQAYLTTSFSQAYYNNLISFDIADNSARIRMFVNALHPKSDWGYWTVTALLICHLSLMAVITACYLSAGGSDNMLGSAWTAVCQL